MFKIDNKVIKVTRGDKGIIDFFIPEKDDKGFWKYQDGETVYWYDTKNKTLYNANYKESMVDVKTLTLQLHTFNVGDIVRFKVFKKKDCGCIEIQKDVEVTGAVTNLDIELTKDDTKIGGLISKPVDYWYEIELNPDTEPQTVIGYDDDGEKIFRLFPEGDDQ